MNDRQSKIWAIFFIGGAVLLLGSLPFIFWADVSSKDIVEDFTVDDMGNQEVTSSGIT